MSCYMCCSDRELFVKSVRDITCDWSYGMCAKLICNTCKNLESNKIEINPFAPIQYHKYDPDQDNEFLNIHPMKEFTFFWTTSNKFYYCFDCKKVIDPIEKDRIWSRYKYGECITDGSTTFPICSYCYKKDNFRTRYLSKNLSDDKIKILINEYLLLCKQNNTSKTIDI